MPAAQHPSSGDEVPAGRDGVLAVFVRELDQLFDTMDPANVSPLVAWLASPESKGVTGQVFEVAGGALSVADGWRSGPRVDKGARFAADEIGAVVHELLRKAVPPQKVYGS